MKFTCLATLIALAAQAQSPENTFDVVSVKPSHSARQGSSIRNNPGRFETSGTTLFQLITYALGVQPFQVTGGPAWIKDDRFDIAATNERIDLATTPADIKGNADRIARVRARLRHLLEDRFRLELNEEQREVPIYALSVDKSGLKLTPAEPLGNVNMNGGPAGSTLSAKGATMDRLCQILSGIVERPVIDETGLAGAFDAELKYSLDIAAPTTGEATASTNKDASQYPSVFTALKEQSGLKLTGKKGMATTWVVVRAEKPTEN